MRTSNRIGRVVLAGTLLMSLSLGSFALADQPASAGDTAPVLVEAGAETPSPSRPSSRKAYSSRRTPPLWRRSTRKAPRAQPSPT